MMMNGGREGGGGDVVTIQTLEIGGGMSSFIYGSLYLLSFFLFASMMTFSSFCRVGVVVLSSDVLPKDVFIIRYCFCVTLAFETYNIYIYIYVCALTGLSLLLKQCSDVLGRSPLQFSS